MRRAAGRAAAALLAGLLAAAPATAECRLALALGLDVSSSVDAREYALQAEGLARALEDPAVAEAALGGPGRVRMAIFEWSGKGQQALVADWTEIAAAADLAALAARVRGAGRSHSDYPTALGYALGYAARLLERSGGCARATLDVSGDGINNHGFAPEHAYAAFDFSGITVNGLVVEETLNGEGRAVMEWYRRAVLRGPGAFLEVADGYEDYAAAMRRKLLRELADAIVVGAR